MGKTPVKKKQPSKWMEVLTDLLLGLLSQPSQLWRNTVEQVKGNGVIVEWDQGEWM